MKYVNDKDKPTLLGLIEEEDEIENIKSQVDTMNEWLKDSGFDQYQYTVVQKGKRAYIELV